MDVGDQTHDVLAHPTRARLFGLLAELRRPAGTDELAARLGLHPNGVRVHLGRLAGAGLVSRERVRQPRDEWQIAPGAQPGGRHPTGYAQLGRWLTRVISGATSLRRVEATGRAIGRELAPATPHGTGDDLQAALSSLGFEPEREVESGGGLIYRLGNCPYRDAVRDGPEVVCTLHRGITRGLLDVIAPGAKLAEFAPRDPDSAGCLIRLRSPDRAVAARSAESARCQLLLEVTEPRGHHRGQGDDPDDLARSPVYG
jgi:predicted ArsR family transcriptional regulator